MKTHALIISATIIFSLVAFSPARAADENPARALLPVPVVEQSPEFLKLYWKAWDIALGKVRQPRPGSGFVSEYMDEGFSDNIFQWDTCFMVMFGRYGQGAVPGIKSFDNFYARQHEDGFIDREIRESDGSDYWGPKHNNSINPPLYAWVEWENYMLTGDKSRFARVYPHLKKYYEWIKANRRLPSGLYWTTNLASGMDNSPRCMPDGESSDQHYGYSWVDLTSQQALSAMFLSQMAEILGNAADAAAFKADYDELARLVNENFWDERDGMYYDLNARGELTRVKTVASFWPLLAKIAPPDRAKRAVEEHLMNQKEFWRPHPFPTLSRDSRYYSPLGGYWRGAVWAPTEYMIIRSLLNYGYDDFAADAVRRHLGKMFKVMSSTGTIWENYAPEYTTRGDPSMGNFVGWSGVGPIAMLVENIIGIRADAPADALLWRIRLTDRHGIENFRFGDNRVTLLAAARAAADSPVEITVTSDSPFKLTLDLPGGRITRDITPGETKFTAP